MNKRPITVRVARWSAEHPWRAMALWVVFVAACLIGGSAAGLKEATGFDNIGEAGKAATIYDAGGFEEAAKENVLITARTGALDPGGGSGGRGRRGAAPPGSARGRRGR